MPPPLHHYPFRNNCLLVVLVHYLMKWTVDKHYFKLHQHTNCTSFHWLCQDIKSLSQEYCWLGCTTLVNECFVCRANKFIMLGVVKEAIQRTTDFETIWLKDQVVRVINLQNKKCWRLNVNAFDWVQNRTHNFHQKLALATSIV